MKNYNDSSWLVINNWNRWGKDDEVGILNDITPADIINAASLIKEGKVYDLETVRFKGMPVWEGHAGFEMLAYASPRGRKNMLNSSYSPTYSWWAPGGFHDPKKNKFQSTGNTELIISPLHVGTHIDGFCHVSWGEDAHWYNGYNDNQHWSDYGPLKCDASTIPPIFLRGVLLDIAGYYHKEHLDPHYGITLNDVIRCAEWEGIEIKKHDCVLFNCGERWPEQDNCPGAGVTLEAARYLVEEKNIALMGNDMIAFEQISETGEYSYPGCNQPVHHFCLNQMGIHFIELVQTGELARDKVYEFCFVALPTKIKGGTGMFLRPVAIC